MDLRGIANGVSNVVNENVTVIVKLSDGYTIGAGQRQIPKYKDPISGPAQIQALDNAELKLLDNVNQQAVMRAIYLKGALAGIIRPQTKGGDLITLPDGSEWLVTKVLESWPTWTKAVITLQGGTQ